MDTQPETGEAQQVHQIEATMDAFFLHTQLSLFTRQCLTSSPGSQIEQIRGHYVEVDKLQHLRFYIPFCLGARQCIETHIKHFSSVYLDLSQVLYVCRRYYSSSVHTGKGRIHHISMTTIADESISNYMKGWMDGMFHEHDFGCVVHDCTTP